MIIRGQATNRKIAETREEFNRLLILLRDGEGFLFDLTTVEPTRIIMAKSTSDIT